MFKIFCFLIILLFIQKIDSDENNEQKYLFQLYPSLEENEPHISYVQTDQNLIVINSTEGKNMEIIERKIIGEYIYKDISSVSLIDDIYLIKTCFGPDKLMEIGYKNKEKFVHKYNYFTKIKFCYSTKIKNPYINSKNPDEYVIMIYWTEIDNSINREKYIHKCILFYPESNTFSDELKLSSGSKFVVNIYYPEKCVTFNDANIFCVIHFSPEDSDDIHILGNHYIIETNKILLDAVYHTNSSIFLVYSNSKLTASSYQIPISLNRVANIPLSGKGNLYYTQYHYYEEDGSGKTLFLFSYYINNYLRTSVISYFELLNAYYGVNIQDNYINPKLFNHLFVKGEELIVLYIYKDNHMSLFLTRFNVSQSNVNKLHIGFKEVSSYTYKNIDICEKPKYLQSMYIISFINYDNRDKRIIENNKNKKFYKYQKDIGVLISCDENNEVEYQNLKVELPQCLNTLDEINGNNKHNIIFTDSKTEEIFDLYGDPNLLSLRNVKINFESTFIFSFLFLMQIKVEGETKFKNITYNVDYKNVSHIKFIRRYNLSTSSPIILKYRLKQNFRIEEKYASQLISDTCELSFQNINKDTECNIDFCGVCKNKTFCQICDSVENIALIKDEEENSETYGKCICDEKKGFQKMPNKESNLCICKDHYYFSEDTGDCKQNEEFNEKSTYTNDKGEISQNIEETTHTYIYEGCYYTCRKCSKPGISYEEQNCDECKEGYILEGNNCISSNSTEIFFDDENNICLSDNKIWFKLGKYQFYYAKIDKCIFIYDANILFFISNKNDCLNVLDNPNNTYSYISYCLNNNELNSSINYKNFINNAKIYVPNANNLTIYKYAENDQFYFHLYNFEMKYNNISSIYLEGNRNIDLLIFKVDIKRKDTISTQVEYQFYNPIPQYIYQTIDIMKYLSEKYSEIQNNYTNNNIEYIYLDLPIDWPGKILEKIKELYKFNINPFDSKSDFYLDVCFKYTTPGNDDIYLQERKEVYYPDIPFCEENCEFVYFNLDNSKVTCKCKPKASTDNYDKITFKNNVKDEQFNKKYIFPNLKVIKCSSIIVKTLSKNLGFFITLLLFITFIILFLKRIRINNIFEKCFQKENPIEQTKNSDNNPPNSNEQLEINDVTFENKTFDLKLSNSFNNGPNNGDNMENSGIVENPYDSKEEENQIHEPNNAFDENNNESKEYNAAENKSNKNINVSNDEGIVDNKENNDNPKKDGNNNINKTINNDNMNGNNNNNKYISQSNEDRKFKKINNEGKKLNIHYNKDNYKNILTLKEKIKIDCENNQNDYSDIGSVYVNNKKLTMDKNTLKSNNNKKNWENDNKSDYFEYQNYDKYSKDEIRKENDNNDNKFEDIKASNNLISRNSNLEEESLILDSKTVNEINPKQSNKSIKNNYIANPPKKPEEFNIMNKISILILCLSFFICLNIFLAFNMSMLHIYYNFKFWCFLLNFIIIPFIISIFIILFKIIFKKCKCNIDSENYNTFYDILGMILLLLNCILVTSFCGIYENSISKLGINITFSVIGYLIYCFILYLLKKYCTKKTEWFRNFANLFNPVYRENVSVTSASNNDLV